MPIKSPSPLASFTALLLLLAACATPPAPTTTDAWIGQWNGPEGTFLRIAGGQGKYQLTIANLDGPLSYAGVAADGAIRFERKGVVESLRASTGAQTGMKWLSDKKDCLTVRAGEGFCRD